VISLCRTGRFRRSCNIGTNHSMFTVIGRMVVIVLRILSYCVKQYQKSLFKHFGNSTMGNNCRFTYKTITVGDHVAIGCDNVFQSAHGEIVIHDNVMFGPGVHVHGGNHRMYDVGILMIDNSNKDAGEDGQVVIEDDVWIGANAIILKRVTIGKGSVVAAGAVVTKDVPSYTVVGGNPARVIKKRFNDKEIEEHERLVQPRI